MNKKSIALAMESKHGSRLLEITGEHVRAAKELICFRPTLTPERTQQLRQRIDQLREEREAILQQFEEREVPANA